MQGIPDVTIYWPFIIFSQITFEFVEYHNAKEHRELFGDDANMCINYDLMTRYNLSGYSEIEYCIKPDSRPPLGMNSS